MPSVRDKKGQIDEETGQPRDHSSLSTPRAANDPISRTSESR